MACMFELSLFCLSVLLSVVGSLFVCLLASHDIVKVRLCVCTEASLKGAHQKQFEVKA